MWRVAWRTITFNEDVFQEIREHPRIVMATLLILLLAAAQWAVSYPGLARYYQFILAEKGIPAAKLREGAALLNLLYLPVSLVIPALIVSGEALLLRLGGQLSLVQIDRRRLWSLVLWCFLPVALGGLIQAILIYLSPPIAIPRLGLNLGVLAQPNNSFAWRFLSAVNPFTLYSLALLVVGAERTAGIKRAYSAGLVFGAWLILVIVGAASGHLPGLLLDPKYLKIEYLGS